MNCEEFNSLLSSLDQGDDKALRAHAAQCPSCARLLAVTRALPMLSDGLEVPGDVRDSWRRAIREEEDAMKTNSRERRFSLRSALALAAAAVVLVGGSIYARSAVPANLGGTAAQTETAALGTYEKTASRSASEPNFTLEEGAAYDGGLMLATGANSADASVKEQKIIRTASLSLVTATFSETDEQLKALCEKHGGHVASSYLTGGTSDASRRGSYTLRIPSSSLDAFLGEARALGRLTSISEDSQDATDEYYDIASRLATQEAKLARLQALMTDAADLSDLIELESAIADTQYQIDSYKGSLKNIDSRADESTVDITLREETPAAAAQTQSLTLIERVRNAFSASIEGAVQFLNDLVVFLTLAFPWIVGLGALTALILIVRKSHKKKKENQQ